MSMVIKEPTKSYALVKADRMYAQCATREEMKIIDRYAKLIGCKFYLWGMLFDPLQSSRRKCLSRLSEQEALAMDKSLTEGLFIFAEVASRDEH